MMDDDGFAMPLQFTPYDVRGFTGYTFRDRYNAECSIQESSSAFVPSIWLGRNEGRLPGDGPPWPDQLRHVLARMHLTQAHVASLLPLLQHFVATGELPEVQR